MTVKLTDDQNLHHCTAAAANNDFCPHESLECFAKAQGPVLTARYADRGTKIMAGKDRRLGVGILGAASIARKNVKAIGKTKNGLGILLEKLPPHSVLLVIPPR
jgi:hypothetical protein